MTEYIIPPMTDVGPVTKIEKGENGYKATIGYTAQAIDEMVRRVNEKLDEEMMARLAEQHGYVRVVRCRDCKHLYNNWACFRNAVWTTFAAGYAEMTDGIFPVEPDGFCKWGERKEGGDD